MKKILKMLLVILSMIFMNVESMSAHENWAPIMVNDILIFVPYVKENNPSPPIKPIQTLQDIYTPDNTVSISVHSPLSGDKDWAGVYKKDDNSDWANVIAWNWVEDQDVVVLDQDMKPMPVGEYEVRLFFHNSTSDADIVAKYAFSVRERLYGTEGPYVDEVRWVKTTNDDGKVTDAIYYVEGEENLPTVIFMSGWKSNLENYHGFLRFIASLGYCVIAKQERGKCFTPSVYEQELRDQLTSVHNTYQADVTKLGLMGHSSGGGTVHYLMNYFRSNHIAGTNKSVTVSIDGWFPFGMTKAALNTFDSPTLLIQFGGFDGINTNGTHPEWDDYADEPFHHYQDPKINMAIFKSLTRANVDKEYVILEADNNHSYIAGDYASVIVKTDVLAPIDQFLDHTLGSGLPMTLINQYNDVITNDLISEYRYYCHTSGFNFCDLDNLVFP